MLPCNPAARHYRAPRLSGVPVLPASHGGTSLRVLVTGASGLIGGEVCGRLAERGHAVTALVHQGRVLSRSNGRDLPAGPWQSAPPRPGEVLTLAGDLRRPALGLGGAESEMLAGSLDLIVHCAAVTGFNLDPGTYRAVNVEGVARMLAFAERDGRRFVPLLYVSTAYVCGERSGPVTEEQLDTGQRFANGYEASKAAAERLVGAAHDRGMPVAIARPSIVVGAWADGAIGRFGNIYALVRLVTEGRVRIIPAEPGASLDLVPIDHVAGGLVDIAERMPEACGRTFHLVSGASVAVGMLRTLILSYEQFDAPCFVPPDRFDLERLGPTERAWHGQVTGLYSSYCQRDPRFRDAGLRALSGRICPPTDWDFLRRIIDHAVAAGFLRATRPAAQRTSG